jgi:DNA-binding NarL/FixJ family response regulator
LVERRPKAKILVLTGLQDSAWLVELLQAGANGYLLKRSVPAELVRAIRTVLSGSVYIDPVIASTLLIRTTAGEVAATALSSREVAVLKLVARGFGNKEMAAGLMLSIKTVQTYKARAMKKLHLRTRADIVRYGAARGWIDEI